MKARQQRLVLASLCLGGIAASAWFVLSAFQKNLVFFLTPTQVQAGEAPVARTFRIGGLVEPHSLSRQEDGLLVSFVVTDQANRVTVRYKGMLPDLFKEGKGVVAQGHLDKAGLFVADEVLAKHDENYMPPQVSKALAHSRRQEGPAAGVVALEPRP